MSKTLKPIKVEFPKYPNPELRHMMLHTKGGPMQQRRDRKAKEQNRAWRKETW